MIKIEADVPVDAEDRLLRNLAIMGLAVDHAGEHLMQFSTEAGNGIWYAFEQLKASINEALCEK